MNRLLENHRKDMSDLCRRHSVRRLEVFGSATNDTFHPTTSDLDFLIDFEPMEPREHSRAYFGMLFQLEELFRRPVDLVESSALTNPFFLDCINQQRQILYDS